jgi:hypothetical protein
VAGFSAAFGTGLDLSQPFTLRGMSYSPLPGMTPGYYSGQLPTLGAVQGEALEPEIQDTAFILSLNASDALLSDTHMSLQETPPLNDLTAQSPPEPYLVSTDPDCGSARFRLSLPVAGSYTVWCRVMTSAPETDSFYVSINGGPERVFETKFWAPVWQWTRLATYSPSNPSAVVQSHALTTGSNEIAFRCRDANTLLSRLLITNDLDFVPAEKVASRVAVQIRQTNDGQVLSWSSTPGAAYRILFSPDFVSAPWTIVGEPFEANGEQTEWLAPTAQSDAGFYWVHAAM